MQRKDMKVGKPYRIASIHVGRITAFGEGKAPHAVVIYDYLTQTYVTATEEVMGSRHGLTTVHSRDVDPLSDSADAYLDMVAKMNVLAEYRRDRQYLVAFNEHFSTYATGPAAHVTDSRQDRQPVRLLLCEYEEVTKAAVRTGSDKSMVTFTPDDFRSFVDALGVRVPEPIVNVAPPGFDRLLDADYIASLRAAKAQDERNRQRAGAIIREVEESFKVAHEAKVASGERAEDKGRYYSPGSHAVDRTPYADAVRARLAAEGLSAYDRRFF